MNEMKKTISCIGCGTMGGAILSGLAKTLSRDQYHLCGYNRTASKMAELEKLGIECLPSAVEAAKQADILIVGVKPHQIHQVVDEAQSVLKEGVLLVSLAAGITLLKLTQVWGPQPNICRCMPTTTASVGSGIFALCFEEKFPEADRKLILEIFGQLGRSMEIKEEMMTNFSALIGAGPAYVFQLMQALVQAGITLGFTHAESRDLVASLFAGAAHMAEALPKPLMQMRDEVCSPGGLTIAGINVLDRSGINGILIEAVLAARARGKEMEK